MVFLNTGTLVKFYQNVFCYFKLWFWIGQYHPFHIYFVFKEFCYLWVLSPRFWNVLWIMWMRFSKKNLLHRFKKWRDDSEIPKKLFLCFIFGWKICKVQTYSLDCPLRLPFGSVVSLRFRNSLWEGPLVRIRLNYFFFYCLLEKFWVVCFLLNALLNISFIYWFCTLCSF